MSKAPTPQPKGAIKPKAPPAPPPPPEYPRPLPSAHSENLHAFHNRLRILSSLDSWDVPGLWSVSGFINNPWRYFVTCSDADRLIIWNALRKREQR